MKKCLWIVATLIAMSTCAVQAQKTFTLKLGAGVPMGDFGDAKVEKNWGLLNKSKLGGAGTGFNLGMDMAVGHISSVSGLDIILSADVFYNGLNSDVDDYFEDMEDEMLNDYDYEDISISTPKYINIPVMVGARYSKEVAPNIALYGEAGIGANLRIITNLNMEGTDDLSDDFEYTQSYDNAITFGFRAAAGITFSQKYSIELGYYNLGAGKVKGKDDDGHDTEKFTLSTVTPTLLTVRLGISL